MIVADTSKLICSIENRLFREFDIRDLEFIGQILGKQVFRDIKNSKS